MPESRPNRQLTRRLQNLSTVLGLVTAGIGLSALLGWILDVGTLTSILPGWPTMKLTTALCFIVPGIALIVGRSRSNQRNDQFWPGTTGTLLVLVGTISLLDRLWQWSPDSDQTGTFLGMLVTRLSPITATIVLLFGNSFIALHRRNYARAQLFALVCLSIGLFCVIGLAYGLTFFSDTVFFATLSLNTSMATICLAAAILFRHPDQGLMRVFTEDISGEVLRRLLPFVIGLPILFGWLRLRGEHLGWYGTNVGVTLFVAFTILAFTLLAAHLARHLRQAEIGRRRALRIVEVKNAELEVEHTRLTEANNTVEAKDAELRLEHEELLKAREQLANHARHLEEVVVERTQKLQASVRSLETFVYTIAHDLRAPLRAMRGFSTALEEDYGPQLDTTGREYCNRIAGASLRMDRLLSDLLEYGRLSHMEMPRKLINLDHEVDAVLEELQEPIAQKGAKVEVLKPLPQVCAEAKILDQVLVNLVNNALKFVPPDVQPKIQIYAARHNAHVRLWVEDNGIGIAPEHQKRIFEVFQRLHSTDEYPGTGIGLAIVQKAVEQMGGQVGVQSEIGKGSRFWIDLPAEARCAA